VQKIYQKYTEKTIIFAAEIDINKNIMTPVQIEKLKKEKTKAGAALQLVMAKVQTLKEENRQLHKKVDSLEEKISRGKARNVRLKQSLDEELKKNSPSESFLRNVLKGINLQI
jgi:predicted  nucleic acid-binding Zn-ribbon protein